LTPAEEALVAKYVRVQAMIGMRLTPLPFRRKCSEYIDTLSATRRDAAAADFRGTTTAGKEFLSSFLGRCPELKLYWVGTLELRRVRNSRSEVIARWVAALTLLYRHERIVRGRRVWIMDETATKAQDIILHPRQTIIGGKGLDTSEGVVPDIRSAAAGCTAAFTSSASGDTAPPFSVAAGGKHIHVFFCITPVNYLVPGAARPLGGKHGGVHCVGTVDATARPPSCSRGGGADACLVS